VADGVQHDVGDVIVGEGVFDLAGLAAGGHDAGGAQHAQVLGDQRLADAERGHELVHGSAARRQLAHDRQPDRRGQRLEQRGGGLQAMLSRIGRHHMQKLACCRHMTGGVTPAEGSMPPTADRGAGP